jgi:glyoxylase-like metal-dependent hydrolase (beta-lactamase superfamily II)
VIGRRGVLRAGAAACAAATPFGMAARALAAPAGLEARPLPGGLWLIAGAGGAVVAARGPDGMVLVDCGQADKAEGVLATAAQKTGQSKVSTLFNTCWRLEQTGGNDLAASKGAKIVAHENTRLWMGAEIDDRWEKKVYPPRAAAARPTKTFYSTETIPLGGEKVEVGYLLQAHTDGDIYVFFRKANVLVAGNAVAGRGWPYIDIATAGWIGGHVRGLETLAKVADDKTAIVTGDGEVLTKADIVKQHEMHQAIMTRLQTMMESGYGLAEVLKAAPAADYVAERGDPTQYVTIARQSFWGHVRQFRAV